jgi:hypothetical protein
MHSQNQQKQTGNEENEIVFDSSTVSHSHSSNTVFDTAWSEEPSMEATEIPITGSPKRCPLGNTGSGTRVQVSPDGTVTSRKSEGSYRNNVSNNSLSTVPVLRYELNRPHKPQRTSFSRDKRANKIRSKDFAAECLESSFKIFMLLLEPSAKIFELIQIVYDPDITTIGSLIAMIPPNTTEPTLATQTYVGLTRPKRRSDPWLDPAVLASKTSGTTSAHIHTRDILVAIPQGYVAKHMVRLGKTILANPRMQRLLDRTDPVRAEKRRARGDKASRPMSRNRKTLAVLQEEPDESTTVASDTERSMQRALAQAEATNAAVEFMAVSTSFSASSPRKSIDNLVNPVTIVPRRSHSILPRANSAQTSSHFVEAAAVTNRSEKSFLKESLEPSLTDGQAYEDDSAEGSYTSWSQSFDTSFYTSHKSLSTDTNDRVTAATSKLIVMSRRQRRLELTANFRRGAIVLGIIMMGWYYVDPNGYGGRTELKMGNDPLGTLGSIQLVMALFVLAKLQLFVQTNVEAGKSKCPFLQASVTALERLTHRCSDVPGKEAK